VRIQDRQGEGEQEKKSCQPAGEFHEYVCRLRAENIFRHARAKGRAESFALGALHQNDQHHEQRDQYPNREENIDQDRHRDAEYGEANGRSKRRTLNVERPMLNSDIRRWTLGVRRLLLYLIPNLIHLGQLDTAEFLTVRLQFILATIKARDELVSRRL
jgi:hypothetical protein